MPGAWGVGPAVRDGVARCSAGRRAADRRQCGDRRQRRLREYGRVSDHRSIQPDQRAWLQSRTGREPAHRGPLLRSADHLQQSVPLQPQRHAGRHRRTVVQLSVAHRHRRLQAADPGRRSARQRAADARPAQHGHRRDRRPVSAGQRCPERRCQRRRLEQLRLQLRPISDGERRAWILSGRSARRGVMAFTARPCSRRRYTESDL